MEVLHTRQFRKTFLGSLSRDIQSIFVVSPFVTPIRGFKSTYDFFSRLSVRIPEISMTLVTMPPSDLHNNVLSWQEADLIAHMGVHIVIRSSPTLHSKIYYVRYRQGDTRSFIGSANFTRGGFEGNDESVAFWRRGGSDLQLEKELARLTGPGSFDLTQWKIRTRKKILPVEEDDGD